MTTMIERVAAALTEKWGIDCDGTLLVKPRIENLARAAIAAMREPTPAILDAGWPLLSDHKAIPIWQAMIDAALQKEE